MKWPPHGSNPQYLFKELGLPLPEHYIDLSANINPLGPPNFLKEKWAEFFDKISDYPDPNASSIKSIIAQKEDVSVDSVLIGNGGAELITLLGRMLARKNVLMVEPTFSEYEKACRANESRIFYHHLKEPNWDLDVTELHNKLEEIDAVFLCNPNNPTGVCYPYDTIVQLLEQCKQNNCYLIVDEAFYDFVEDYVPIAPLLKEYSNLIILRSMTKMFAIPGLRLGYILAHQEIIKRLAAHQPHWSVNVLATLAGEECLRNEAFIDETIKYIRKEREELFSFFEEKRYAVSPSQINFYLLRDPVQEDQFPLFQFLLQKGIVPRHTFNFPSLEGRWLRFAIKGSEENGRLMEVLTEWKNLH